MLTQYSINCICNVKGLAFRKGVSFFFSLRTTRKSKQILLIPLVIKQKRNKKERKRTKKTRKTEEKETIVKVT